MWGWNVKITWGISDHCKVIKNNLQIETQFMGLIFKINYLFPETQRSVEWNFNPWEGWKSSFKVFLLFLEPKAVNKFSPVQFFFHELKWVKAPLRLETDIMGQPWCGLKNVSKLGSRELGLRRLWYTDDGSN